jgi:hypothetical protein
MAGPNPYEQHNHLPFTPGPNIPDPNQNVVRNIIPGTDISVDETDPEAPIVSVISKVIDSLAAENTDETTTSILEYGVNVFTTVTSSDYAAKLPQPKTGKSTKIVNMGAISIVLFPSNVGGRINNLPINTPVTIPPDGIVYEFTCIENPLPGAWVWTPPATSQYDSGDITCTTTSITKVTVAANALNVAERTGFVSSSGWGYDGKNRPRVLVGSDGGGGIIAFKDLVNWNSVKKIKVYTNLSADGANVTFGLSSGCQVTKYTPPLDLTADITGTGSPNAGGSYGSITSGYFGGLDQIVAGASLAPGVLTANIGDAGTCWGELNIVGGSNGADSRVGDYFEGLISGLDNCIQPRQILVGFKFRFFIEFN